MGYEFAGAFDLEGKTALVTGGAAGIGLAICRLFASRGANVVMFDSSPTTAETVSTLPGGAAKHLAYAGDVTRAADCERAVAAAVARFRAIDILVNNAGIGGLSKAEETTEANFDQTLSVNLKGPFLMTEAVGKLMIQNRHGRIVSIASQASVIALDKHLAYCTSKAGLVGMTKVLALEWAKYGITVNAVSPTVVETDLARKYWVGEIGDRARKAIPTGRFAQPEEIAAAVLYLVSGVAGMINGENLVIDGGFTIQ